MILFRGTGAAACRYLEADRSQADDYYLEAGIALATFTITDATGAVNAEARLDPDRYAGWVDWTHPLTGERMGTPRLPGEGRRGSPRFAEMVVNTPKSLSIAAALHPEVSDALDAAQQDAVAEIRRRLAQHSVTRAGPRGAQEVVPVEAVQTVAVSHRTSRAGDPHRHVHFQLGTRVWAAGAWRGLDTAALLKQQGAIRALGTAVIAAHPGLADVLDRHGLTLEPVTGEVTELVPFNPVMSKRAAQVERNLARLEAEWEQMHPGEEPGPVVRSRLLAKAWAHAHRLPDRPRRHHPLAHAAQPAGPAAMGTRHPQRHPAPRQEAMTNTPGLREAAVRLLGTCEVTASMGAAVARVTAGGGAEFIIKQHGSRAKHEREVHAYRHWTRALGPFAPELVAIDDPAMVIITTALPSGSWPGERTAATFRQAGALLRRFHDAEPPIELSWFRDWLQDRGRHWASQARTLLSDAAAETVASHLAALGRGPVLRGSPCHLDFQPRNWLVSQSGDVSLIDFEHSRIDLTARDFVRLRFRIWTARPDLQDAFFDGYGRPLTEAEDELVWHLGALDALTALARGNQTGDQELTASGLATLRQLEDWQ